MCFGVFSEGMEACVCVLEVSNHPEEAGLRRELNDNHMAHILAFFFPNIFIGRTTKMYSTKLTVSHATCSELTPPTHTKKQV